MKKKAICAVVAVGIMGIMSACSGEVSTNKDAENKTINIDDVAGKLQSDLKFEDSLSEIEETSALQYYGIDKAAVKDSVVIISTGATAEEIAIFEASSKDDVSTIEKACKDRLDKQTTSYESYKPAEVDRLKSAIIEVDGNYVFYVVADDKDKANDIIDGYFK